MIVDVLQPSQTAVLPPLEVLPVEDARTLDHFRIVGSACFRVPPDWFAEVFNENLAARTAFPLLGRLQKRPARGDGCQRNVSGRDRPLQRRHPARFS